MAARRWIRKSLMLAGWLLAGTALSVLLVGAIGIRNRNTCKGVRIAYAPPGGGRYVDTLRVAMHFGPEGVRGLVGRPLQELDLNRMERSLEKDPWIRDADLYLDRGHVLHARIVEQTPVARIFTRTGLSFYIDSQLHRIPLNTGYTERLPVFTGLPISMKGQQPSDTQYLRNVWQLVQYLRADELGMAIVDQADYEGSNGFVLIPKVGDHRILFGDARDIPDKFRRLRVFYQQVMSHTGWNSYRLIDLRFHGQVVATPSARPLGAIDTLRSLAPDSIQTNPNPNVADTKKLQMRSPIPKIVMPAPRT